MSESHPAGVKTAGWNFFSKNLKVKNLSMLLYEWFDLCENRIA
jgi:hypothetical protein